MRIRRFIPPSEVESGMNITPLIDVMFMLLLFFVLTSVFLEPSLELNLPGGTSDREHEGAEVTLSLDRSGALSIDGAPADSTDLVALLDEYRSRGESPRVLLRSDERVAYGEVFRLVDLLTSAHVEQLYLAHNIDDAE